MVLIVVNIARYLRRLSGRWYYHIRKKKNWPRFATVKSSVTVLCYFAAVFFSF